MVIALEFGGRVEAERLRAAFFAAARALLDDPGLSFEEVPTEDGQRWAAKGAVFTCRTHGDPPQPVDPRCPSGWRLDVALEAGGHRLTASETSILSDAETVIPHALRKVRYWMNSPTIVWQRWPGLTTFDAVWAAMVSVLREGVGFRDWTATAYMTCKNAESALEAGDKAGAEALLSRCDPGFERPTGRVPWAFRKQLYSMLEGIRPLTRDEEAARVDHDPHHTPAWQRVADAGGGGRWQAWEARQVAAMQRPWDRAALAEMPPGGEALALLAMGHPHWPWDRPDPCPSSSWHWTWGWRLMSLLRLIGFSDSAAAAVVGDQDISWHWGPGEGNPVGWGSTRVLQGPGPPGYSPSSQPLATQIHRPCGKRPSSSSTPPQGACSGSGFRLANRGRACVCTGERGRITSSPSRARNRGCKTSSEPWMHWMISRARRPMGSLRGDARACPDPA